MSASKDLEPSRPAALAPEPDEPPVVARMVIEIRSDGSRTIARGALEDVARGETVQVRAEATTPLALALQLARSLTNVPAFAQKVARKLLKG